MIYNPKLQLMEGLKLSNISENNNIVTVLDEYSKRNTNFIFKLCVESLYANEVQGFIQMILGGFVKDNGFSECFNGYTSEEINRIKKSLNQDKNNINIFVDKLSETFKSGCISEYENSGSESYQRFDSLLSPSEKRKLKPNSTKPKMVIGDNVKVRGNIPKYESRLITSFVSFCVEYLKIQEAKIDIQFRVIEKALVGYVKPTKDNINWEVVMSSKSTVKQNLIFLAHELTHVKQSLYKELYINNDGLGWSVSGEEFFINGKDYRKLMNRVKNKVYAIGKKGFEEYKSLPWETEAYANGDLITKLFLEGEEVKKLIETSTDPSQKFILENI